MEKDSEGFAVWNGARWSGRDTFALMPPAIGTDVSVTMNGLGRATVLAHEVVEGYLGLRVRLHNPPDWYVKQNGKNARPALVFGAEIAAPRD